VEHTGKVALITGGSAGIGLAVAEALTRRGATVVLVARGQDALDRAVAALGPRAHGIGLDVADLSALAALPARVVAAHGRLDVVVNNAGLHHRGPVASRTPAELDAMVTVNLTAPVVLARAALDHLGPGGVIVGVASVAGWAPLPDAAVYSATKAGLRFFDAALAAEVEGRGVRVATVSPGPVDTGFFGEIEGVSPLVFSQPMSTAAEVADAVVRAIEGGSADVAIPARSGLLATAAYLLPGLARWLRPRLARRGELAKRAYIERKREEARLRTPPAT
jgi:hypothetical protein